MHDWILVQLFQIWEESQLPRKLTGFRSWISTDCGCQVCHNSKCLLLVFGVSGVSFLLSPDSPGSKENWDESISRLTCCSLTSWWWSIPCEAFVWHLDMTLNNNKAQKRIQNTGNSRTKERKRKIRAGIIQGRSMIPKTRTINSFKNDRKVKPCRRCIG